MMTPARFAALQDARVNIAAHPLAWPAARLARRVGDVVRVPGVGIVVSAAEVAHEVLTDDEHFVKRGRGGVADVITAAFGPSALANMDGEAHRALRQRLGALASPDVAEQWCAASMAPLDAAACALEAGERVDIAGVSRTLAGRLTLTLLGAEGDDDQARQVHALGERIAGSLELSPLRAHGITTAREGSAELVAMLSTAYRRRDLPPESLMARLKLLGCDESETRGVLSMFFVAGALTLGVALPRVVALLVDAQRLHLLGDEVALRSAIEEAMRFTAPIPATVRIVAAEARVGALNAKAGERVVILTTNLARDAALFPHPDRFDPSRAPNPKSRYLWYGAGAHFCVGFPLAQRALTHAVSRLARVPGPLRVRHRWPAHSVLLPAWRRLVLAGPRA